MPITLSIEPTRTFPAPQARDLKAASTAFWIRIVSPELLFLAGTVQALFPYLLWHFSGLNENYHYGLSYIPAVIYVLGFLAFIVGTRFGRMLPWRATGYSIPLQPLKAAVLVIIAVGVAQFLLATKLYGGVPILNYLKETADVWEINELQNGSFMGQLGLLTFTTFLLSATAMLVLVKTTRPSLFTGLLLGTALILCFLISSMAGKRQGFLMCAFIVGAGLLTRMRDPIRHAVNFFGLSPRRRSSLVLRCAGLLGCLAFVGVYVTALNSLRVGDRSLSFSADEITKYLEFPLINFEFQTEMVGFGPERYAATPLLIGLVPQKIVDSSDTLYFDNSFYPEPTASAGVYGPLHLYSGLVGCIAFAFVLGAFCKFAHLRAMNSDLFLMIYAQCSWPLFVSYSFNLFLRLVFVVGPLLAYWAFCRLLSLLAKQGKF